MADSRCTTNPFETSSPRQFQPRPPAIQAWTQCEYDVLMTLSGRIRIINLSQAARIWWPDNHLQVAKRALAKLCKKGLLETTFANVEWLKSTCRPIADWRPGKAEPNFVRISTKARSRWSGAAQPQQLYFVSRRTGNLFGSSAPGLPPVIQRDHDLLLAQAYVYYRTKRPQHALQWVGEDTLPKAGYRQKDPDAFLVSEAGVPIRVIESAGRYSPGQVESFHRYCVEYDLPYELW